MEILGDSNAYSSPYVLPQHQAALTILGDHFSEPAMDHRSWLDLACGKGQIIQHLPTVLSETARAKIKFYGFDVEHAFLKRTERLAEAVGFHGFQLQVGQLKDFNKLYDSDERFDFVTLINTLHEAAPSALPEFLCACILRLSESGTLFIYDMESLSRPELGAVTWTQGEIATILDALYSDIGVQDYRPQVSQWEHRTCKGWSTLIRRSRLGLDATLNAAEVDIANTRSRIKALLESKLDSVKKSLTSLAVSGTDSSLEEATEQKLLYDFFAITHALEAFQ